VYNIFFSSRLDLKIYSTITLVENEKHFESKDNHYNNNYIAEYLWITEDIEECVYYCRDPSTFRSMVFNF